MTRVLMFCLPCIVRCGERSDSRVMNAYLHVCLSVPRYRLVEDGRNVERAGFVGEKLAEHPSVRPVDHGRHEACAVVPHQDLDRRHHMLSVLELPLSPSAYSHLSRSILADLEIWVRKVNYRRTSAAYTWN